MIASLAALGATAFALFLGGCEVDCSVTKDCAASALSSSSSGAGGGDPFGECVPRIANGPVSDTCGIFVATAGDDANTGTKASPVATLAKAIELAQTGSSRVYACAEELGGAIVVPTGIAIYGGLDCAAGWTYSDTARTVISAAADEVPLTLSSGVQVTRLENIKVASLDAKKSGGSSIAAIIDAAPVELTRCDFMAGNGADGAKGETPMMQPNSGSPGLVGSNACESPINGSGGSALCGVYATAGGLGGKGGVSAIDSGAGQGGEDGVPADPGGITGKGGAGAPELQGGMCTVGGNGADGDSGSNGLGGAALGAISIAGYLGAPGEDGGLGKPGQGGGGGGGYKSGVFCGNPLMDGPGPSGGGGGSGGCGGLGGLGGKAGGSSIGLIALNATLTITDVTIQTGNGGKGGAGSVGLAGAQGGNGGDGGEPSNAVGSKPACKGGVGGFGGPGGASGGGRGGHSIAVAFQGESPPDASSAAITVGAPGSGGLGASGEPSGDGAIGVASTEPVQFP